jgi:hypothetical protein
MPLAPDLPGRSTYLVTCSAGRQDNFHTIDGESDMKFNDTAPVLAPAGGVPSWLARLAENATLEATVLKRPVEGRADILSVIKHAVSLYEFQHHSYKGEIGNGLYMESYRSQIQGMPIETLLVAHLNEQGETDSVVINHRPLKAALLFSNLMWERVDERFRDLYLTRPEAVALNAASGGS